MRVGLQQGQSSGRKVCGTGLQYGQSSSGKVCGVGLQFGQSSCGKVCGLGLQYGQSSSGKVCGVADTRCHVCRTDSQLGQSMWACTVYSNAKVCGRVRFTARPKYVGVLSLQREQSTWGRIAYVPFSFYGN